jgi:N utilization substance protein B
MGNRREGREAAVQFLYQRDLHASAPEPGVEDFWKMRPASQKTRAFSTALVNGVIGHQQEIDERIKSTTSNFDLHRIATVDRNILRVAIYEMLFTSDVPPVVSINEAIEIAKAYGTEDSGRFVNGILDKIRSELTRPAREANDPRKSSRTKL